MFTILEVRVPPDLYIATLEGVKTPEQELMERERWQGLGLHIDTLPARYARAVRLSYGIGCEPHTLEQIGDQFNVCRERARQIIAKGERSAALLDAAQGRPKTVAELRAQEDAKAREAAPARRGIREVRARRDAEDARRRKIRDGPPATGAMSVCGRQWRRRSTGRMPARSAHRQCDVAGRGNRRREQEDRQHKRDVARRQDYEQRIRDIVDGAGRSFLIDLKPSVTGCLSQRSRSNE